MLAAALFLSIPLPAAASETLDETAAATEAVETLPVETTVPEETIPPEIPPTQTIPEETSASEETVPAETLPEETVPAETAPEETAPPETFPELQILSVAEALRELPGTRGITIRGVVVYAQGWQAVLQDNTGGIRLSFDDDPALTPGEYIQIIGRRTEGLAVEDFQSFGMGAMPALDTALKDAPENHRISLTGVWLEEGLLTSKGAELPLAGKTDLTGWVNVTGVLLDGVLHMDGIAPGTEPEEPSDAPLPEFSYSPRFGIIKGQCVLDRAADSREQAFSIASGLENMDYFVLTETSDVMVNRENGRIDLDGSIDPVWQAGKQAATEVSRDDFLAEYGFEMAWPAQMFRFGHIITLNTPGWQWWNQSGMDKLENYLEALQKAPEGVSMFCHPSDENGNFHRFSQYDPAHDKHMHLLELGTGEDARKYYDMALRKGWHVAPSAPPQSWEDLQRGSTARTAVLSDSLTSADFYDAIRKYRVYATEDADLELYYTLNDAPMGSTIGITEELWAQLWIQDPTDSGRITVEVFTEADDPVGIHSFDQEEGYLKFRVADRHTYYYLVIRRDGETIAVTAPVWMDNYENMGVAHFGTETRDPVEGMEISIDLELYNDEPVDYFLERVEVYQKQEGGDLLVYAAVDEDVVLAGKRLPFSFLYSQPESGAVSFYARIRGYVNGKSREYTPTLDLEFLEAEPQILPIEEVRRGVPEQVYRIEGYVTAGNDNPYNSFDPPMIYVQDASGGIAVDGELPELCYRQRVRVKGRLWEDAYGNRGLRLLHAEPSEKHFYSWEPESLTCAKVSDYHQYGGKLVKIRGKVLTTAPGFDKKSLSRITLRDSSGQATVSIETGIRSAAYGTNTLASKIKQGRTVEAIGIVHIDAYGQTVLRVRNADEVSYIAPAADPSNPKTGDWPNAVLHWLEWLWTWICEICR